MRRLLNGTFLAINSLSRRDGRANSAPPNHQYKRERITIMKTDVYEEKPRTADINKPQSGENSGSAQSSTDKDELMKKAQAAGTPGAAHKALQSFAGEWEAEVKCWMDPNGQASVSKATAKAKTILGGRFLEGEFHGEMMGKPFTGHYVLGFDNAKQKFKSVWIDDFNTAIHTSEGKGENDNKVITLEGKMDCQATGQKDITTKHVYRVQGAGNYVMEMFNDGKRAMEITYTRK
jgi:Protein of unknown function (DUF1579)